MVPLLFSHKTKKQECVKHMDLKFILASLVWFFFVHRGQCQSRVFTVTNYGAVSNGQKDGSQAFMRTWIDACGSNGGLMHIPKGTYYVSGALFEGPCNGETYFQNDGYVIASSSILHEYFWISFQEVNGLVISGKGTFDGNGAKTWQNRHGISKFPPTSIKLEHVTNGLIQGITSRNSKTFHINLNRCDNVQIDHVSISAPGNSPNTDGIHIGKSSNIDITNSRISTGDDCVSIGDGSRNINVSAVTCGPGHGISIGSLGRYEDEEDVSGITVKNCTLSNTKNGLRIKTWATTSDTITVSDVTFTNIHLNNVDNPVIIDQYYCPNSPCNHKGESSIQIENVKFVGIKGSSSKEVGVDIACSRKRPCQGILLQGLRITTENGQPTTAYCLNANGKFIGGGQIPATCSQEDFLPEFDY